MESRFVWKLSKQEFNVVDEKGDKWWAKGDDGNEIIFFFLEDKIYLSRFFFEFRLLFECLIAVSEEEESHIFANRY